MTATDEAAGRPSREATLAGSFTRTGKGLHVGRRTTLVARPAPAGHGIRFRRHDRGGTSAVRANWRDRVTKPLCTALRLPDGRIVRTVEHLLAAFSALAIDNALVELDGEEVPICDGSAAPWCAAIATAGRVEQDAPRRYLRVLEPVEHRDGDRLMRIEPADTLSFDSELSMARLGTMRWAGPVTPETFKRDLAPSRSFGRLKWAVPAKLYGLFGPEPILRGADLGTTAAIWGGRVIGGMTVPDEPVRHRTLDAIGDLSLVGHPILGAVTARRAGHAVNHGLVAKLMASPNSWEIVPG